ncbi:hypothetical protein HDU77_009912 [Chytriomyces hyalinus]|nr:hypothetical protein HDU77_009912 [Chytriomyces hyalinus]
MGGHFNPFNGTHGCPAVVAVEQDEQGRRVYNLPETNPFHVGDFGSLTFNDEGSASAVYISSQLSLWDSSAASFLMGHGFVVHAMPDDCKTQPTGNSSVRLGQGVIAFRNRDAYIKPQLPASTNLGIAYFDGVNGVAGSIVAQGAGAFSFNLTGLPKGKITIMTTMSGDVNVIEPSAICSNETDLDLSKSASKITSLTTDDNGSIIQAVVVDAPHSSLSVVEMLGRGVLIVAGSCANVLAMAPMGIKFVDPPKSTTATSSATATFSDQTSLTAFVSSEPTQASLPAASATSEYSLVQAPQYTASAKPLPAGPGSANLYASSAAGSFLAALMPLTTEQASRVRHEVDHAALLDQVSCEDRILALSAELRCSAAMIKRKKKQQSAHAQATPAVVQEAIQPDQQLETTLITEPLHELDEIVVLKPRKLRIAATEKVSGYFLFMRKLGKDLEGVNKLRKMEDSQAELLQMKEFQMTDSNPGALSKWAALSENDRERYNEMARAQTLANKENSVSTQKSNAEIKEAQRKSYFNMVAAIKIFVKNGGTHIGTSRLPYEKETKDRIKTIALGDMAEQAARHAAKGDQQYQTQKVLAYLDIRQNMDPKDKIFARVKAVGGIQARRATFHGDLLRKYQVFKPDAKNVPITELRQGKIHGIRMINWPNAVKKSTNFTEKELEILERNHVQLVKSTEDVADINKAASATSKETDQGSTPSDDQRNKSVQSQGGNGDDLNFAAGEMEAVLDAAGFTGNIQFEMPAYGETGQSAQTMDISGIDFDVISSILAMQSHGS